mmetsp:Transcript_7225/g.18488  ORF Transcript_7225/g.18488 Transcript_7225/m.18488 type:complete len:304 (-) Transcript_7225:431-1342(-)
MATGLHAGPPAAAPRRAPPPSRGSACGKGHAKGRGCPRCPFPPECRLRSAGAGWRWGWARQRGSRRCTLRATTRARASSVPMDSVSVVLLAGGVGKRMGANIPKQYIQIGGKEVALFSFEVFAQMEQVREIVVVCEEEYENLFRNCGIAKKLFFARPGKERQDSAFNGFSLSHPDSSLVAIHDSARPLVTADSVLACFEDAFEHGAAVLGVPVKSTIKEVDADKFVIRTPDRSTLWEVQTPQVIKPSILREGFAKVKEEDIAVTDDVSIVEALGGTVRITPGDYQNIKLTTPEDMQLAESVLA